MLQFVLGRAGSGKTEYMRRVLSDRSLNDHDRCGDSRCMMIVPEQFSFETEKAVLRLAGPQRANTIGIYSFTRLAETVFRKEGGAAGRRLRDGGRRILMSAAIETCQDHLEVYKNAARTGRVTDLMLTAVDELKMCGLAPAQVTEAAGLPVPAGLSQKLRELGLVYAAYEALVGASYLDSRDDLTRLAQTLEGSDIFKGYTVAVDSFEGFTVQEMRVLGQLLRQADTMLVSLCTDGLGLDDCGLFALVDRTRYRLERLAGDLGIKVLPPVVLTGAPRYKNENLKLLETQLFCPDQAMTSQDHSGIEMFQARDVFEEAEYVAATIRRLAAGGMRYRDITVICRNPSQYYGSLDVALEKRGAPCFMSQPIRVDGEPVCRFLLGAFEVVQEGLDTGALLEMLKTGVTGLSIEEISDLENYAFLWHIRGKDWRIPFTRHPQGFGRELTEEDAALLGRLNELREKVIPSLERFEKRTADASGKEIAQAAYDLLMDFGLEESLPEYCRRLEMDGEDAISARQLRVWDLLMELLDQMYVLLGEQRVARDKFYRLLKEVLAAEDVSEIPQTLDQVIFGTAEQVRQSTPRAVFLIGVTQGDFPLTPRSSGVFSDAERRELIQLDLPLGDPLEKKAVEERYLAYSVASLAAERLYISWPSAVGGEDKEPSELVEGVLGAFPNLRPRRDLPDEYFANSRQAAFSRMAARWQENSPQAAALRRFVMEDQEFAGRVQALERAAGQRPQRVEDPELARQVYGERLFLSPSQIETFHSCPFKYFCRYGLNARERRPAEVDVLQYGTMMHYLFEKIFRVAKEERTAWTQEELEAVVRGHIQKYAEENMGGAEALSGRERYRLERMVRSACKLIVHVEAELAQSRFEPSGLEVKLGGDMPALKIQDPNGLMVTVGGTIDRVDVYHRPDGKDFVRVIDYKTGGKSFRLGDVLYGLNMQMLIYLAALAQDGRLHPAGILYMPAAEPSVAAQRGDSPEEVKKAADRQLRMSGLVLNDGEIIEAMEAGARGEFIPVSLKKDGTPDSRSQVLSQEELEQVLGYAQRLVASMGRELARGAAEAKPNLKNQNTCQYCPYGAVCGGEYGQQDIEQERTGTKEAMERIAREMAQKEP